MLLTPATAHAEAAIEISYVEVQIQVQPTKTVLNTARNIRVALQGGNKLKEQYQSSRGLNTSNLVGPREGAQVGTSASQWRVGGAGTLIREGAYLRHIQRIVVSTNQKSCHASISYRLKPSYKEYELRNPVSGFVGLFQSLRAENIICRITD